MAGRPGPKKAARRRGATKTATKGALHAVPCPYCGETMDFRGHVDSSQGGAGWGDTMEKGAKVDCDHCGRTSKILGISQMTVVRLVQAG